jgi:hypothetical protein
LPKESGLYEFKVNVSLEIEIPELLLDPGKIEELITGLDPAPPSRKK